MQGGEVQGGIIFTIPNLCSRVDVSVVCQHQLRDFDTTITGAVVQGGPVPDTAGKCERISETREYVEMRCGDDTVRLWRRRLRWRTTAASQFQRIRYRRSGAGGSSS